MTGIRPVSGSAMNSVTRGIEIVPGDPVRSRTVLYIAEAQLRRGIGCANANVSSILFNLHQSLRLCASFYIDKVEASIVVHSEEQATFGMGDGGVFSPAKTDRLVPTPYGGNVRFHVQLRARADRTDT